MIKLTNISLAPIALALTCPSSYAFENDGAFDWSGKYFGGMIGHALSTQKSDFNYGNDANTPQQGWTQNQFQGNVYNTIESMSPLYSDTIQLASAPINQLNTNNQQRTTLLAGITTQKNNLVLSGEVKTAFGNFGTIATNSLTSSGSRYGSEFEGQLTFTNYNSVLTGITSPQSLGGSYGTYIANYEQTITQQNFVEFNKINSLVGHIGHSFGTIMIYGLAGLTQANIKVRTQTTINETSSGQIVAGYSTDTFTAEQDYYFYGEKSKKLLGYTIGTGLNWAMNNTLILRIEGEYYNLGNIQVNGTSPQTSASYDVKQAVNGYSLSTGLIIKF